MHDSESKLTLRERKEQNRDRTLESLDKRIESDTKKRVRTAASFAEKSATEAGQTDAEVLDQFLEDEQQKWFRASRMVVGGVSRREVADHPTRVFVFRAVLDAWTKQGRRQIEGAYINIDALVNSVRKPPAPGSPPYSRSTRLSDSTIRRALAELVQAGHLRRTSRGRGGRVMPTQYAFPSYPWAYDDNECLLTVADVLGRAKSE